MITWCISKWFSFFSPGFWGSISKLPHTDDIKESAVQNLNKKSALFPRTILYNCKLFVHYLCIIWIFYSLLIVRLIAQQFILGFTFEILNNLEMNGFHCLKRRIKYLLFLAGFLFQCGAVFSIYKKLISKEFPILLISLISERKSREIY